MEPIRCMGYHADLREGPRNHQSSREAKEWIPPPSQGQGLIQRDKLKPEKLISQSSVQFHHEIKPSIGDRPLLPPKSMWSHQKYSAERKAIRDEELVDNMSNLPSYLQHMEKGGNLPKKVLNFGVLDWQHLERSKYNEKHPFRSSKYPQSTSYTSSSFSTVGSSTLSSRSDLVPLGHQRKQQPPVLSSHLNSPSRDIHSRGLKPTRGAPPPQKLRGTYGTNNSLVKLEKGSGKTSESKFIRERRTSSSSDDSEVMSCPNGKTRAPENEFKQTKKFHEFTLPDQRCPGRQKTIVLLLPRSSTRTSGSGASPKSESSVLNYGTSPETNHRSFSGSNCSNAIQSAELSSAISHSGPMVCRVESSQQSDINLLSRVVAHGTKAKSDVSQLALSVERPTVQSEDKRPEETESTTEPTKVPVYKHSNGSGLKSTEAAAVKGKIPSPNHRSSVTVVAQGTKVPSDAFQSPLSAEMPTVEFKGQRSEETGLTREPMKIIVFEPSDGSGLKALDSAAAKRRSPSPNRRTSVGLGRMGRSFSFKEGSPSPQSSSACVTSKTPMGSDSSLDNSNRDKVNANSRARSSPLRRLLDPILRPKSSSRRSSTDFSQQESPSTSICESSQGWLDSSDGHLVKRNLDFSNCDPTNTNGSHVDEKHLEPMVQALLQVTVRNGLPWFTFAVDNNSDVLAATMRKTSICGKYDCSWIYTFYSFHKITKKSGGWIGQGSKAKNREYVPNNVGQMKVSGSQCPTLTRHHSKDQVMVREFVLLGVEPRPAGEECLDIQPNNELAAIIVKVPKETNGNLLCDEWQSNKHIDLSDTRLPKCLPGKRCYCNLVGSPQSGILGSQNVFGTVVLLPNGVHGLSASGVPSPLVDRWKSGGSCDCGGWDVGCGIRVLSDQKQQIEKLCSSKALSATDQCDLLVQGGQDHVSLTTYRKGIYSIDFKASISSLQAFSVCIAFLHSRNLAELSEMDSMFEEVTLNGSLSLETDRMKLIA